MYTRLAKILTFLVIIAAIALPLATPADAQQIGGLLAKVKERGRLLCGVNNNILGFGYLDQADNTYKGFDPEFCRVLAAALFGDVSKVEYKPLPRAADRFPALASGDIDVLIRNTTNTYGRDTAEGADFGPVTFYDAGTLMVRTADKYSKLEDFKNLTICAIKGITNEQVISEVMDAAGLKFTLGSYDTMDTVTESFNAGRCDAITSDRSQLIGRRLLAKEGKDWTILELNLSKEPFSPAVKQGDPQWADFVRWAVYATILLEEKGVTSKNVDEMIKTAKDTELRRLLGIEEKSTLHQNLGLNAKWAYNIAKLVGNYGEIYDRTLGGPAGIKRGQNDLWTRGGLMYVPPYR